MPIRLWPVTIKVKNNIEKCVELHQELYWHQARRDTLELRAVTVTYETGKFRSKCLWKFEPFEDEDVNDAKRLHNCILSLLPERSTRPEHNLNSLKDILERMWFSGHLKNRPYTENIT